MNESGEELVRRLHREAAAQAPPPAEVAPPTIHYTELPEARPGEVLGDEWNTYRREVGRWLAEGQEGRHVLIKGDQVIGLWDTDEEAMAVGYQRFLGQPFLVHQIQARERVSDDRDTSLIADTMRRPRFSIPRSGAVVFCGCPPRGPVPRRTRHQWNGARLSGRTARIIPLSVGTETAIGPVLDKPERRDR